MDDGSRSHLCLEFAIVFGFKILGGVVYRIILIRVLCYPNVGFYVNTPKGFSRDQLRIWDATHQCVCQRRI
jgi:hypothetical protein